MLSLAESPSSISINIIYSIGNNSVFFHFSSYIWSITAYNTGDMGLIPGLGKSPRGGNDNPFQYSCLGKSHGQRSPVGYSPWGCCKESGMTYQLNNMNQILKRLISTQTGKTSMCTGKRTFTQVCCVHITSPVEGTWGNFFSVTRFDKHGVSIR